MKIKTFVVAVLIFIVCSFCLNVCLAEKQDRNKTGPLKLFGQVDVVNAACAASGIMLSASKFPATIEKVRLGSPAFYNNIAKNDKVISGQIADNKLNLTIERNRQRFFISLNTRPIKV